MKKCILLILVMAILPVVIAAAAVRPESIRVALMKGETGVKIDGAGLLFTDLNGLPLPLSGPVEIRRNRSGLIANDLHVSGVIASAPAFVTLNGKNYRGLIECLPDTKGLLVVNELPVEEYLIGLINCEISSQWPMEAIKAQAVIARSYALYQKASRRSSPYDLESNVMDQVYQGSDIEDSRAARGVEETTGEVITFGGSVIQAFYHSNCGGHTESAENVWGARLPYLQGVDCKYCVNSPSSRWEQTLPLKKLEAQLRAGGYTLSGLKDIVPGARNSTGRLADLTLVTARGRQSITAPKFRMAVGSTVIKSTNFEIRPAGDSITFSGTGYGHGVGLCQWGAKQRAADGFDYREILVYYYPGVKVMVRN